MKLVCRKMTCTDIVAYILSTRVEHQLQFIGERLKAREDKMIAQINLSSYTLSKIKPSHPIQRRFSIMEIVQYI